MMLQHEVQTRFLVPVMNTNLPSREECIRILQELENSQNEQKYILQYQLIVLQKTVLKNVKIESLDIKTTGTITVCY